MNKILLILISGFLSFFVIGCNQLETTTLYQVVYSSEENNTDLSQFENDVEKIDALIYPHDEVIQVNIDIEEEQYIDLIATATDEVYHPCNITYNGYTLNNVAIRAKGNSSLRDVARSGGTRFSYNVDLNYYEDQDLFGLDKLILNNLYMDPTMMAEYTAYEAMDSLGVISSKTTYIALFINELYYGLYLSVEHVGNEMLDDRFGNSDGEFYKPEPSGGPTSYYGGASLLYVSDSFDYTSLIDKFNDSNITDNSAIIHLMKKLSLQTDIELVFDNVQFLKYLAVSTYTVNLDSYQGGVYHNYYLYNNDGIFVWIPWDLNMAYNGFPAYRFSDTVATTFLIDEPVINQMSNYPLVDALLSSSSNIELYHGYLQQLIDNYYQIDSFTNRVNEIRELIDYYVVNDPNGFYTYTEFTQAISSTSSTNDSILQFVLSRNENVQNQLSGLIPSTNNRNGNEATMSLPR